MPATCWNRFRGCIVTSDVRTVKEDDQPFADMEHNLNPFDHQRSGNPLTPMACIVCAMLSAACFLFAFSAQA